MKRSYRENQRAFMENDFIPYSPAILGANSRVMVLAPHPDDEVLGCGGALAMHVDAGHHVDVIVLTDGAAAGKRYPDRDSK